MAVATSRMMNINLKILGTENKKTLTVVMNTRSQNRLTITKLELVLITRFVELQGL